MNLKESRGTEHMSPFLSWDFYHGIPKVKRKKQSYIYQAVSPKKLNKYLFPNNLACIVHYKILKP